MKLIDLLVQELPKRGGWPDGAVEAGFLCSNTTLYFIDANGDCPSEWCIEMDSEVEDNDIEMVGCNEKHYLLEDNDNFATVEYVEQENRFCADCGDETIFDFSTLKVFDKFQ